MDTNVMMDCECYTGWNVEEDGYECYDELSIWYRLDLIYLNWILMLRMDTNVIMDYEFDTDWVWLFIQSGYKC